MSEKSLKFLLIGNLLTIFILLGLSFLFHNQFSSFENQIFDTKFQIKKYLKNTIEISSDIIHINIDDYSKSRQQSSEYWSKKNEANLFNKIADENSKIILCDLLYVSNRDTSGNKSLIEAINKCNNVISPFVVKFDNKDFSHDDFFEISGLKFNPNSDQKYLNISKIIYKPVDPIIEHADAHGGYATDPFFVGHPVGLRIVADELGNEALGLQRFFQRLDFGRMVLVGAGVY